MHIDIPPSLLARADDGLSARTLLQMLRSLPGTWQKISPLRQLRQLCVVHQTRRARRLYARAHRRQSDFLVLPLFEPQPLYRLDDQYGLAELNHVAAFLGDDVGCSRRQAEKVALP